MRGQRDREWVLRERPVDQWRTEFDSTSDKVRNLGIVLG